MARLELRHFRLDSFEEEIRFFDDRAAWNIELARRHPGSVLVHDGAVTRAFARFQGRRVKVGVFGSLATNGYITSRSLGALLHRPKKFRRCT